MRSRNLIILAAVVVALGVFIFFVERHQPTSDELASRVDRVFPEFDGDTVVAVEIESSHGPVRLSRVNEEWRLTEPMDYPADASAVRSLVGAVANLDAERILSLREVKLADYGLDDPTLGVDLVDSQGRRFCLTVGDATPLGSNRAVRRDADDEIMLSSGAFVSFLDKEIDDWRSRDVIDLLEDDLASIDITTAEDRIRVERADDHWQLIEPLVDLADPEQIRSLVSELNALRVSEFLPADLDSSALGLDEPGFKVVLTRTGNDENETLELAAADDGEGQGTVVCRRNSEEIFRVPASIVTRLAKAPVLWRSDKVWSFNSWDVSKVELSEGGGEVVLDLVDGLWQFHDGGEADNADVRRRLNALADLEAREHDLVLPPTEVMGSVILVLDTDRGAEGVTYTFFSPIEVGGHAAVTVSARGNVIGIDAVSAETIVGNLDRLRPADSAPAMDDDVASEIE